METEFKVIIAGGRDFDPTENEKQVKQLNEFFVYNEASEIVCGMAEGADRYGYYFATQNNYPVAEFEADWDTHGKWAGNQRNEEMGDYADYLVALWDGKSKGTQHMINYMRKLGKPVEIILYNQNESLKEWI